MAKNLPATQDDTGSALAVMDPSAFADDMGAGFEETSSTDYAIPFLKILQALSPECSPGNSAYDEELRPGMFYNSVTHESYKGSEGLLFVPSYYRRVGLLWTPKDDGGGFKGSIDAAQMESILPNCTRDDRNNEVTPDGLHLIDTREWYVLIIDPTGESCTPVLMSLSKTQLKKSKRWLTLAQGLRYKGQPMPLFSQVYRLTTVPEKNDQGSWMGLELAHVGSVPSMNVYAEAKRFREMVISGSVKSASYGTDDPVAAGDVPYTDQF